MPDGSRREEEVTDHAYRLFRRLEGENKPLPDYFVDAQTLTPADHVVMQAAVQRFVDSSISKTINVPVDIAFDSFKDVYLQAYELGCKGCTTYRPNEVTGSVLSVSAPKEKAAAENRQPELPLAPAGAPGRPLRGGRGRLHDPPARPAGGAAGQDLQDPLAGDGPRHLHHPQRHRAGRAPPPFEVFINSKSTEHYAWTVALTRMISAVFRRGGDVSFVVEELKAVFDPRGGTWMDGRYVPPCWRRSAR